MSLTLICSIVFRNKQFYLLFMFISNVASGIVCPAYHWSAFGSLVINVDRIGRLFNPHERQLNEIINHAISRENCIFEIGRVRTLASQRCWFCCCWPDNKVIIHLTTVAHGCDNIKAWQMDKDDWMKCAIRHTHTELETRENWSN